MTTTPGLSVMGATFCRGHAKVFLDVLHHAAMSLALALSSPQTQGELFSEPIFLGQVAALLP